ncbi:VPLPA-CTERM protein sorting domain-containing protein [Albimonas donghaensis]|uniref:VPLPA-CTERM protein sorting domain-containing protein n=1 Tax=Albimonas donghaensis TaxID=356660 RepID=A0A1H3BZP0_9RHOB|nr:VPLPA-CTERM sorting domain-containing protein [Albimonas donghaensis]SDX47367.1 VPLPA-CTERM protein sorting domain-containing protein [Albimonas donghaensis]
MIRYEAARADQAMSPKRNPNFIHPAAAGAVPRFAAATSAGAARALLAAGLGLAIGAGAAQALPVHTREMAVQLVSVCTDSGATCLTPEIDETLLQTMFDPAGIALLFPTPTRVLNFSYVEAGGGEIDVNAALVDFRDALAPPASAHTAYIGGVRDVQGGAMTLSYVGGDPYGVVQAEGGLSLGLSTMLVAHSLGHILGAPHDGDGNAAPSSGFIMASAFSVSEPPTTFSEVSLAAFGSSALPGAPGSVVLPEAEAPLPAAGGLMAAGLGALALFRRRRRA